MEDLALIQLWSGTCPDCEIKITLEGELPMGRLLVCPNCSTSLGFAEGLPVVLGWLPDDVRPEYEGLQDEFFDKDWTPEPLVLLT